MSAAKQTTAIDEAAYWHTRVRNKTLSDSDRVRFETWLASDPAHHREFAEIEAMWSGLSAIAQSPEVQAERKLIAEARASAATRRRVLQAASWALAASVLGGVGVLAYRNLAPTSETYATAIGEQRTIRLEDGSSVTLNTSSEVRVTLSKSERKIDLLAGQASFDVAKDHTRPFIVTAGGGQVLAVGTVFEVYKRPDRVVVTLIEGRVEVVPDLTTKNTAILNAGEQISYGGKDVAPVRASVDLQQTSAWRARKLNFIDTPLADAVAEANRYSRQKIEVRAPGLQDAKISGVFDAGRNESVAEGLSAYFRLHLEHAGDDLIVLTEPPH